MLTFERLRELLDYNPETGSFVWRVSRPGRHAKKGQIAGRVRSSSGGKKYRQIHMGSKCYLEHRLAYFWMTGTWPEQEIDHIDGNGENNKWVNIRSVTKSENRKNRRKYSRNTSGVTGVTFHRLTNKWQASIKVDGRSVYLGLFSSYDDAVKCRKQAEVKYGFHPNHGSERLL